MASLAASATELLPLLFIRKDGDNSFGYIPNFGANLAALIIMALVTVAQIILGVYYRQRWFGIAFCIGLGLEIAGYIGRVLAHSDPTNSSYFMLQIVCLTVAPTFLMAGIYSLPAKFAAIYGPESSPIKPMTYSYVFISLDFLAIVLQGGGGGMAASASNDGSSTQAGTNVMIAGLVLQVISMIIFFSICGFFTSRVMKRKAELVGQYSDPYSEDGFEPRYQHIRNRKYFGWLKWVVGLACLFIFVRSIFRCVELGEGWNKTLMSDETYLLVLEALMMVLAVIPITVIHPGLSFGRNDIKVTQDKKSATIETGSFEMSENSVEK